MTNHSTDMAVLQFVNNLTQTIDNGNYSVGIFLDLSNAFYAVDHDILLCKMSHYGIKGIALNWFNAYLSNRKQYVVFNGVNSNLINISCGIPLGFVLGPILFILYINDITYNKKHFIVPCLMMIPASFMQMII